jgi:hypothetical protein
MDEHDRLRHEYDGAVQLLRSLTDTRFKLLALVPSLSGTVVALVPASTSRVTLLAIGLLGLAATLGVLVYELRNGQVAAAVGGRVRRLEEALFAGGPLVPRPGLLTHTLGVALVYGAALGGWSYLVAWGALRAAGVGAHSRSAGLVLGAVAGVLVAEAVLRLERRPRDDPAAPLARPA